MTFVRFLMDKILIVLLVRASNVSLLKRRFYQFPEVIKRMSCGDRSRLDPHSISVVLSRAIHKYTSPPSVKLGTAISLALVNKT